MVRMNDEGFLKNCSAEDINVLVRGDFISGLIEMQKITVSLDSTRLTVVNVAWYLRLVCLYFFCPFFHQTHRIRASSYIRSNDSHIPRQKRIS